MVTSEALKIENEILKEENQKLSAEIISLKEEIVILQSKIDVQDLKYSNLLNTKDTNVFDRGMVSKRFEMVTVLFANIHGFQNISVDGENAQSVVDEIDHLQVAFDAIIERLNIKKVKSIGDSYMCAGGIPKKNRTNPLEIIMAALELQAFMKDLNAKSGDVNIWDLCIGIHTGPVSATISGKKKITYELKGDAANIASRIEAYSKAGQILISEMTYEFVRDYFTCDNVGSLPVKYIGAIAMYEVKGFSPVYSFANSLILPNKEFYIKIGHIRFDDLEDYVLTRLENELPKHLYYHNVKHTMDVVIGVEVIGTAEKVSEEEMLLLKTAALFHDMGQIVQSKGHEQISCNFALDILPNFYYDDIQIQIICDIIMATQLPPNPKDLLQKIICDADLDYLGRTDFVPVSDALYEELYEQNIITDKNEWNKLQIKFITNHQYFTTFAKNNREVNKQKQIDRIKSLIF
ncbi:MAG: HD domain-containing protein [Bacteroidales bacterium]|nr:HD domain-containing protein [Bacteroidales bacterium]